MIIGIDISSIPYGTGVSNYTLNLVKNLISIDKTNSYKLFFSSFRRRLPAEIINLVDKPRVSIYQFKIPLTLLNIFWNRFHLFPIELFIGNCDIFHTSDWTQPPTQKAKSVTTVHDLTPFLYPLWHHPKIISTHRLKMNWAVKDSSYFICVSRNTQTDLLKIFPQIEPSHTSVIYEAAENVYFQSQNQSQIANIKQKYGLNHYVLAQGTREPRKNLSRLIKAFNLFQTENPLANIDLVITGKYGWGTDIKPSPHIKVLGYIPDPDLLALHGGALCLAYPSLYEGFGLPVVKSMACGIPVLTSNTSSLPEITHSSAVLVNPYSVEDIKNGLKKLLGSASLRKQLSKKGILVARQFNWTQTAKETLSVYQKYLNP